jgi:putative PIN family toxin of toxin-antitoxin system
MRVVVDTNVLVSSVMLPRGRLGWVLDRFRAGSYQPVTSTELLGELVEVLRRPRFARYGLDRLGVERLRALIEQDGEVVVADRRVTLCRDPKDNRVLEAAAAAGADLIVSGDDDLLVLRRFRDIPIVSPARFAALLAEPEA